MRTRPGKPSSFFALRCEDPNNVEALNNLGVTLKREQNFTAAMEVLRRAARIAPKDARIRSNLASAFTARATSRARFRK